MQIKNIVKSALIVLALAAMSLVPARAADTGPLVYVGTYTGPKSKGIYLFRMQPDSGALQPLGVATEVVSPSFLELDPKRRLLFSVNEVDKIAGKPTGGLSSFSINPQSGQLTLINQQSSMGTGPCHLLLDKSGKNLLVANYGSGSVASLPVANDGHLGEASSFI